MVRWGRAGACRLTSYDEEGTECAGCHGCDAVRVRERVRLRCVWVGRERRGAAGVGGVMYVLCK